MDGGNLKAIEVTLLLDGFPDLADFSRWCHSVGVEVYERKRDGKIILECKYVKPCDSFPASHHTGGY